MKNLAAIMWQTGTQGPAHDLGYALGYVAAFALVLWFVVIRKYVKAHKTKKALNEYFSESGREKSDNQDVR